MCKAVDKSDDHRSDPTPREDQGMKVARVTLSDRASAEVYEDRSGPEIERVLGESSLVARQVDERSPSRVIGTRSSSFSNGSRDEDRCSLVLTGPPGAPAPPPRDVTPEATRAIIERELPGFGEVMRIASFPKVPYGDFVPCDCRHAGTLADRQSPGKSRKRSANASPARSRRSLKQ